MSNVNLKGSIVGVELTKVLRVFSILQVEIKVIKVNTCRLPKKKKQVGKYIGWKSQHKKAVITLSENDIINLFDDN